MEQDERAETAHQPAPKDDATSERPYYAPRASAQQGPDDGESVVADDDLAMRGAGAAGESAGSGSPGLGGSPGGTPNHGGVGLPGGNRRLGAGPAPTSDASHGGTVATGGLGTGGNARSGRGRTPSTEILPGGATRSTEGTSGTAMSEPTEAEDAAWKRADQGALNSGAMMHNRPGSAAAYDIPTLRLMDRPGPEAET